MARDDGQQPASEERRAEWAQRVESFARDAAPRTRPFAETLVAFVAPAAGARVLDIATGSGIVAVEAAQRVGPQGSVLATDFVPEWEPYVAETAAGAGVENVSFAIMPAESLELPDASFDVVLCQFGLMFVDDYVGALKEMRRVLRPGGKLGIAVWSVPERVGLFTLSRVINEALPPPTEEPPPSPLALGAPGLVEGLVSEAGFRGIVVERPIITFDIPDADEEWRRWSEGPLGPAARLASLPAARRDALRVKALNALEVYREGEVIRVPSEAVLVSAVR